MYAIYAMFHSAPFLVWLLLVTVAMILFVWSFRNLRRSSKRPPTIWAPSDKLAHLRLLALLFLIVTLSACSQDLSPREQSQQLMSAYLIPQQAAVTAVQSPQLAGKPAIIHSIRTSTDAATAAIGAFDDEARKCVRDQTSGAIVDAPGQTGCNPSLLPRVFAAATAAIGGLGDLIKSYGF